MTLTLNPLSGDGDILSARGDVTLQSDSDASGAGDIILKTATTERLRVSATTGVTVPNTVAVTMTTGGTPKYTVPIGGALVQVDRYGNLLAGQNKLLSSGIPGTGNAQVPDFAFLQNTKRLFTRNISLGEIDDPADLSGRRFGPSGGYPNAAASNGDATNAALTGLGSGTCVFQLRSAPGVVPYGGDQTTAGATAPVNNATIGFYTSEIPRDLTGAGDYALGSSLRFQTTPVGSRTAFDVFQLSRIARLGRSAIGDATDRGLLYIRGDAGLNEQQQIAASGTVTSGTFTLTHYGTGLVPPGQTTAPIAWNASAATVKAALEALGTIGAGQLTATGGPLPGTQVLIEFSGSTVKHSGFTRMGLSNSLVGGTFAVSKQQDGLADDLASKLLYLRHGGGSGDTPTGNYLEAVDPSGTTILTLDPSRILTIIGDTGRYVAKKADATTAAFTGLVAGDSQERFIIRANGALRWGPGGSTATDITLSRTGVAQLLLTGDNTPASGLTLTIQATASQGTTNLQQWQDSVPATHMAVTAGGLLKWSAAGDQQTTVGAAGAASALPATPTKYLKVVDSAGTTLVVPAYAAS